eukprot:1057936-Pleurochrysis_carterae.AAC.1
MEAKNSDWQRRERKGESRKAEKEGGKLKTGNADGGDERAARRKSIGWRQESRRRWRGARDSKAQEKQSEHQRGVEAENRLVSVCARMLMRRRASDCELARACSLAEKERAQRSTEQIACMSSHVRMK